MAEKSHGSIQSQLSALYAKCSSFPSGPGNRQIRIAESDFQFVKGIQEQVESLFPRQAADGKQMRP